jgi:hypothetical protein
MKVIVDFPPNIVAIHEVFPNLRPSVVFTYGNTLCNPSGMPIPGHLMAHEKTHTKQQAGEPARWWDKYLADPRFRLSQEVEAYHRQFVFRRDEIMRQRHLSIVKRETLCKLFVSIIASDLSSEMYGNCVVFEEAVKLIKGEK